MTRPAEAAGGLVAAVGAAAYLAGVRDPEALAALAVLAGTLPGLVSSLIDGVLARVRGK